MTTVAPFEALLSALGAVKLDMCTNILLEVGPEYPYGIITPRLKLLVACERRYHSMGYLHSSSRYSHHIEQYEKAAYLLDKTARSLQDDAGEFSELLNAAIVPVGLRIQISGIYQRLRNATSPIAFSELIGTVVELKNSMENISTKLIAIKRSLKQELSLLEFLFRAENAISCFSFHQSVFLLLKTKQILTGKVLLGDSSLAWITEYWNHLLCKISWVFSGTFESHALNNEMSLPSTKSLRCDYSLLCNNTVKKLDALFFTLVLDTHGLDSPVKDAAGFTGYSVPQIDYESSSGIRGFVSIFQSSTEFDPEQLFWVSIVSLLSDNQSKLVPHGTTVAVSEHPDGLLHKKSSPGVWGSLFGGDSQGQELDYNHRVFLLCQYNPRMYAVMAFASIRSLKTYTEALEFMDTLARFSTGLSTFQGLHPKK